MHMHVEISGFLVGPIWWPAGAECFKPFRYDVTAEDTGLSEPGTLRDHVLRITNDGDFQFCALAQAELTITLYKPSLSRSRSWPLEHFPSIADCLHGDPDWFPASGEE